MSVDSESTHQNTSRMMYFIIIVYLLKNSPKMTLWVSQSVLNSHPKLKMSVDSESTHQNTSTMMYFITRSNSP
jgi:hypothetical protein